MLGVLCVLAAHFLTGCAPKIEKLEIIHIGKIRLDSITPDILSLRAEILIRNPYSTSARLKNISFDLAITDHPIAYGKLVGSTDLSGGSTRILDVPLAVQCKQVMDKDLDALFQKNIPYHITGSAVLERPFGPRTLPIEVRNEMVAPEDLELLLNNKGPLKVIALDVSETQQLATLIRQRKLSLRLHNPFSLPLTIQDFHYEARLGQGMIANGEAPGPFRLDPGKNRINVTVQPHSSGVAGELLDLLLKKTLPDLTVASNFDIIRNARRLKVRLIYAP